MVRWWLSTCTSNREAKGKLGSWWIRYGGRGIARLSSNFGIEETRGEEEDDNGGFRKERY